VIGSILLVCVVLYAIPRTSVLGAIAPDGTFTALARAVPFAEIDKSFL